MSKIQKRKHYSGDEKVSILRCHLVEKVPVSDLCEHYHVSPAVFYRWQKEFFEKGGSVFQSSPPSNKGSEKRIVILENKLAQKNEVLAELMEEHLKLKKTLGRPAQGSFNKRLGLPVYSGSGCKLYSSLAREVRFFCSTLLTVV